MPENSCRESIDKILHDAPTARKNLLDNHSNLHRLADYCQNKYFNVDNTRSVIEESRAFTTQALASVTYQINNLAASLLKLLDAQTLQLKQMESSVNMLSQTVDIFKENVARREIGVLTTGSIRLRTQKKALPPNGPEPLRVYRRIPISYTRLDKLGHSHWERNKTEESTEKENRQSFQQISAEGTRSSFSWPFQGFAVPPPSVPDFVGSNITAPPACSPASPSPPLLSACSPSLPPYVYQDLSMLPPPPPPYDEMEDAPPPPPPSPPQSNMPSFPPNTSVTLAIPPPPPTQANMAIPPPPPPSPTQGKICIPPPPPPPPTQGNMGFPAPPPPPPPPAQGNMAIPPPPPPARSSSSAPTPPPLPTQSTPMVPPPPPLLNTGGKFVPPPPPPLPQFKC
ncbi:ABI gene family member 3 isoform X2 [Triplophysa dalaica]|uniref:ABI gene family member 3 isoform X2 n=1 Tax=Triplophysa dalaica TaxID=1582913 RepID=UPI0024DFBE93|nr:ABI gene family member 3 isoform X2 [Triplophysa dalaica]